MKLTIAICDDEQTELKYLNMLVKHWADDRGIAIHIRTFISAENFLFTYEENKSFDILLLDIEMGKMNGVELAKHIRRENEGIQIIFITGFSDFIAEGYEVSALHYLLKPVNEKKLSEVLDKAQKGLSQKQKSIIVAVDGQSYRIPMGKIMLCESFAHSTVITTKSNSYNVRLSISELKNQLDETFIQCHRSYLVGISHISHISKTDVFLDNGHMIPLSRRLYNEVNQAFIRYFKGVQ
jgi:DNA-binding LytR/AlgR family response regulator